jgi:hypothetical protein
MDNKQRKTLEKSLQTWQKWASRYSQRPGQNWLAQEWVLLQIINIDGVSQKKASTGRKKTAVMAYGRPQAIEWYQKWLDSSGDTENVGRNFVNHSTSNMDTLKLFWTSTEDKFVNVELAESTSTASGTIREEGSHVTQVTTNTKKSPSASATEPIKNDAGSQRNNTEEIRNDAGSQRNHTKKNCTVPTVTNTSNNDRTGGLLYSKNQPSSGSKTTPCKAST